MNTSKINIIVVDDDSEDQMVLKESLLEVIPNFEFSTFFNGNDCLKLLKNGSQPDLIFMDLTMPFKSGLECLREIYNENLVSDTPIIVYSRSHHLKDISSASEFGARFFLVKPDSQKSLTLLLKHIIYLLGRSKTEQLNKSNFVVRKQKLQVA